MSSLILELKQGESMILNGAVIRFKTRARLELNNHARFLFGKQIMQVEDAVTPARRVYFALQQAYIGPEEERVAALARAKEAATAELAAAPEAEKAAWAALLPLIAAETGFEALKYARGMVRAEEKFKS